MLRLVFSLTFLCVLPALAGEYAVLSSGARLRVERHETSGSLVRLFLHSGVTEFPAAMVVAFEPEDYVEPPAAPAPVALLAAKPAPLEPKTLIQEAARKHGLPPAFVESVARVESGLRPDAVSPKGAIGVMQLMPGTAQTLGANPHDMEQNIDAGTRLLRELLLKYEGDVVKALAAYNAGAGAVARYQGLPPYTETRQYVNRVIGAYKQSGGQ